MKSLASRAKIGPDTIVRGPTTRQFWCAARRAPAIAHLVGVCPDCGVHARPTDTSCEECGADFLVESDRQFLGLGSVVPIPGQPGVEAAPLHAPLSPVARAPLASFGSDDTVALDRARRGLASTRSTLHWITTSVIILVLALLALAYLANRAGTVPPLSSPSAAPRAEAPSEPASQPEPADAPREAAPATAQPTVTPKEPAPPAVSPELARARKLLDEGAQESVREALKLAENSPDPTHADWLAIKQAAQRRLDYLNLRKLR
jgi:hypothetical protein